MSLEPLLGSFGLADKVIPYLVINAARKVERFLGLYFCADGWADRSGAHFGSKSRAVCLALKRMLLRFGIVGEPSFARSSATERTTRCPSPTSVTPRPSRNSCSRTSPSRRRSRSTGGWGSGAMAPAPPTSASPRVFLELELLRRTKVTGRSARSLGVDSGGHVASKVLHRDTLDGLLFSERLEDLRTGDLLWDTVESIEYVGDKECFDFEMLNLDRPYAVVEDFVHNCGKKIACSSRRGREKFVLGCNERVRRELGTKWFDIIEPFAD